MKEPFKLNDDFHKRFADSLNKITEGNTPIPKAQSFRKAASIAASLLIIGAVAILSADASGIIDLNNAFSRIFDTGYNTDSQYIEKIINTPNTTIAESTSEGVTARIIQTENHKHNSIIIVELCAKENILNPYMHSGDVSCMVEGDKDATVTSYSYVINQEPELSNINSIEELKQLDSTEIVPSGTYTQEDLNNFMLYFTERYKNSYTDKIYMVIELPSDLAEKNLSLTLNGLFGLKENAKSLEDIEKAVDGIWKFNWTMENNVGIRKTYNINNEFNGIHYENITLTPISIKADFLNNTNSDIYDIVIKGVKFKNGEIQVPMSYRTAYDETHIITFYKNLLDIDQIQSIFVGKDFVEIPLE